MIFITGDFHADWGERRNFIRNLSSDDILIVLGDWGWTWNRDIFRHYLRTRPVCMQLWIDGNHDNHSFWSRQEVTQMFGGYVQVHPHSPNIIHLMRGEIYQIEDKTIFCFGGAVSIDKQLRIPGYSWWEKEQATEEEIQNARKNLAAHNNKVDYIFTHTMPMSMIIKLGYKPIPDRGAEFFDEILHTVDYTKWYCGHFHLDQYHAKEHLQITYNQIYPLM